MAEVLASGRYRSSKVVNSITRRGPWTRDTILSKPLIPLEPSVLTPVVDHWSDGTRVRSRSEGTRPTDERGQFRKSRRQDKTSTVP